MSGHRSLRACLAGAFLVLAAACSDDSTAMIPEPPTTLPRPSTTAQPDLSGVPLAGVPGRNTTTTVSLLGGKATLKGTVNGGGGLVPGAVVRIERVTDAGVASGEVPSSADGTWLAPGIQGGRYRVRAWRVPDFAQIEPAFFYLGAEETKTIELAVTRFVGVHVVPSVAPNPPLVGEPANLVVLATLRQVDGAGYVQSTPLPNVRAELFGAGTWRVDTANPTTTDAAGRARWQIKCSQAGDQPLSVLIGDEETAALKLPGCTASGSTDSTVAPSSTTSTTRR